MVPAKAKKVIKVILIILLAAVLIVGGYVAYVMIDYHRIEDNQALQINDATSDAALVDTEYKVISYNIGFAAYTPDFGFFMDGGTQSRAESEESVKNVISGVGDFLKSEAPDFILIEEVDKNATRSYHYDEEAALRNMLEGYDSTFTVNFDSPYLFYPLSKPHGKSYAGMLTLSRFNIESGLRRSLPIEDGFMKFVDLDRCYSVSRVSVSNDKELVLYTLHLSAYTSDGTIATEQLTMLINDMQAEYEKGNYCIAGGDFNKDLLVDSGKIFGIDGADKELVLYTLHLSAYTSDGTIATEQLTMLINDMQAEYEKGNYCIAGGDFNKDLLVDSGKIFGIDGADYTWAQPVDPTLFDGTNLSMVAPFNEEKPIPSCRNADGPYNDKQFVLTVDGFIVSDNVTVSGSDVYDLGFKYSDHNPVYMTFKLNG